jgi:hypothetical protein
MSENSLLTATAHRSGVHSELGASPTRVTPRVALAISPPSSGMRTGSRNHCMSWFGGLMQGTA